MLGMNNNCKARASTTSHCLLLRRVDIQFSDMFQTSPSAFLQELLQKDKESKKAMVLGGQMYVSFGCVDSGPPDGGSEKHVYVPVS